MEYFHTLTDTIHNLYKQYELEITWSIVLLLLLKLAKELSFDNILKKHNVTNHKETFLIDISLYRHNKSDKFLHILTLLIVLPSIIFSFNSRHYHQLLLNLGSFLMIFLSLLFSSKFLVEIHKDIIILDSVKFRSENINKLEVWDNMITIHHKQKEQDIKLTYAAKNFELLKQMIFKLKSFCSQHHIVFEDHNFQYNLDKNEVARK